MPPECRRCRALFPVMLQVEAVAASAAAASTRSRSRSSLRRRAFAALRELLTRDCRAARARPLHRRPALGRRGQRASCSRTCCALPDPPPLLTVACFRTEEIAVQAVSAGVSRRRRIAAVRTALSLEPMTEDEARDVIGVADSRRGAHRPPPSGSAGARSGRQSLPAGAAGATTPRGTTPRSDRTGDARRHAAAPPARARRTARGGSWRCWPSAAGRWRRKWSTRPAGLAGDERPLVAILRSAHLLRQQRLRRAHRDVSRSHARDAGRTAVA